MCSAYTNSVKSSTGFNKEYMIFENPVTKLQKQPKTFGKLYFFRFL